MSDDIFAQLEFTKQQVLEEEKREFKTPQEKRDEKKIRRAKEKKSRLPKTLICPICTKYQKNIRSWKKVDSSLYLCGSCFTGFNKKFNEHRRKAIDAERLPYSAKSFLAAFLSNHKRINISNFVVDEASVFQVDGGALEKTRKQVYMSRATFASRCGWSVPYQYQLERDIKWIDKDKMNRILRAFGLPTI